MIVVTFETLSSLLFTNLCNFATVEEIFHDQNILSEGSIVLGITKANSVHAQNFGQSSWFLE